MIHVMEDFSLRERRKRETRLEILDAYLELSHRDGAMTVSVPQVAQVAGVSTRTVYRYFADKDELQNAAAFRMSEQALFGGSMSTSTPQNIGDQLKMLWTSLAANIPAVVAERTSPAGREIRITRLAEARETSARALPTGANPETIDLLIAVTSSSMFLELVERMGYAPEVAAQMAARTARLLVADEQKTAKKESTT